MHVAAGIVVKLHSIYGLWAPAFQLRREAMPVDPLSQLPPLPQTRVRSTMGKLVAAGAVVTHTVHGRSSIDRAIRSYLESSQRPEWWALYADATVPHVARSDLGRYALLYEEGGLYMDIDAELLTEGAAAVLNASYMGQAIVWTEKMVEISELGRHEHPHKQRLAQYALFAPPRHQLLDSVLRESFLRLSKLLHPHPKLSRKKAVSDGDVLWATGPDAVTSVVWEQNIRRMLVPSRPLSARMVAHEERGSWRTGRRYNTLTMPVHPQRTHGLATLLGRGNSNAAMGAKMVQSLRRDLSSTLPVEAWYVRGEIASTTLQLVSSVSDTRVREVRGADTQSVHETWRLRAWMLLDSAFDVVALVDPDVLFFSDPHALLLSPELARWHTHCPHAHFDPLLGCISLASPPAAPPDSMSPSTLLILP